MSINSEITSITSKVSSIENALTNIKSALNERGATTNSSTKLSNVPALINGLSGGDDIMVNVNFNCVYTTSIYSRSIPFTYYVTEPNSSKRLYEGEVPEGFVYSFITTPVRPIIEVHYKGNYGNVKFTEKTRNIYFNAFDMIYS